MAKQLKSLAQNLPATLRIHLRIRGRS